MSTVLDYKCPCCGGKIEFNPNLQEMKCPYCDSIFSVESLKEQDSVLNDKTNEDTFDWKDSEENTWTDEEQDKMKVFTCNSCGGEIITDENTAATHCPYCGNPVVLSGRLSGSLKPDYVIPFQLDKKVAIQKYNEHITKKRLLPKLFKSQNHIDEIKGVYIPFWLYDANSNGDFSFHCTKTRTWSDSKYIYTETGHFKARRSGSMLFNNVPVDGSKKMPDDLMESIEPFSFSKAVDFKTAYLSGYFADKYDVNKETSAERAKERMKLSTENSLKMTVNGFDTVKTESGYVNISNTTAKYALYPIWLLSTTYEGKNYLFAMNGQTGKFVGDLPLDKKAAAKWFGLLSIAYSVGAFLVLYILQNFL